MTDRNIRIAISFIAGMALAGLAIAVANGLFFNFLIASIVFGAIVGVVAKDDSIS